MRTSLVFALGLVTGACSSGSTLVTGRIADGFPSPITTVKVFQDAALVASAPVGANGDFRVEVPSHATTTIHFVGSGYASLVMPRRSGSLDHSFTTGGGEIALGAVQFVDDASATKFVFRTSASDECQHTCHEVCVGDGGGDDTDCDGGGGGGGSGSDGVIGRIAPPSDGAHMGDAVPEFDAPSCGGGGGSGSGSGSDGIVL